MAKVPSLTLWSAGGDPTGGVQIDIELSGPWSPKGADAVTERLDRFVNVGLRGGYPVGAAAASSRLDRLRPEAVAGNVFSAFVEASSVDRRAYQCLRHMVASLEFGEVEPRRIQVREVAQGLVQRVSMPLVSFDNEGSAYPQPRPPQACGFNVEWADTEPSKSRVVLVEFAVALTRADFVELAYPVQAWGALVEANAFSLPEAYPDEVECVFGQMVMFDRCTVQIEVPRFIGSESAWDCLLCLLDAFSERHKKISVVTIE